LKGWTAALLVLLVAAAGVGVAIAVSDGDDDAVSERQTTQGKEGEAGAAQTTTAEDQLADELEEVPGVSTAETQTVTTTTETDTETETVTVQLDEADAAGIRGTMNSLLASLEEIQPGSNVEVEAVGPDGSRLGTVEFDAAASRGTIELGATPRARAERG
jgi:hypothetical protein